MDEPLPASPSRSPSLARGFSLVETLVATSLLAIALGALAELATLAASTNARARAATVAALLAASKTEELLAVPWLDQRPLATDSAVSLERNIPGFFDLVDQHGGPAEPGEVADAPSGLAYLRRWAVRPLAEDPGNALVLKVVVVAAAPRAGAAHTVGRAFTIRGRRDWWEPAP